MGDQNRFEEWQLFFLFISQRRMEKGMRIIIQYRIFPTDPRATFRLFRCVAIIHARSSLQIHVRFGKSVCVCSDLGKQRTKRESQKELNPKSRDKKCFYFLFFFSLFFLFIFSFFFPPLLFLLVAEAFDQADQCRCKINFSVSAPSVFNRNYFGIEAREIRPLFSFCARLGSAWKKVVQICKMSSRVSFPISLFRASSFRLDLPLGFIFRLDRRPPISTSTPIASVSNASLLLPRVIYLFIYLFISFAFLYVPFEKFFSFARANSFSIKKLSRVCD